MLVQTIPLPLNNPFIPTSFSATGEQKGYNQDNLFEIERKFTQTYKNHLSSHPAIREAMCLRVLYPSIFKPIEEKDLIAGRIQYPLVGFGLEQASGGPGYYCRFEEIRYRIENESFDHSLQLELEWLLSFWANEATIEGKLRNSMSDELHNATANQIASMGGRLAGALIDFDKLVLLGLPGLQKEVIKSQSRQENNQSDLAFTNALLVVIELLKDICRYYADMAIKMALYAGPKRKNVFSKRTSDRGQVRALDFKSLGP